MCDRPAQGPKGTIPFIHHGKIRLSDSFFIIQYLINTYAEGKTTLGDLKLDITPRQQATVTMLQRVIEGPMQMYMVSSRWVRVNHDPSVESPSCCLSYN